MRVTTPRVVTCWPSRGLVAPLPWICGMVIRPLTVTLTVQFAVCSSLLPKLTCTG